jgi:hypothetical protein
MPELLKYLSEDNEGDILLSLGSFLAPSTQPECTLFFFSRKTTTRSRTKCLT